MAHKTKDGRWRAHRRVDGVRLTKRFRTRTLAEVWERDVLRAKESPGGDPEASSAIGRQETTTFEAFSKRWLAEYCALEKAPSQLVVDKLVIERNLVPAFGGKLLGELRKGDLQVLRSELAGRVKPKTVNNVIGLAKRILAVAVDWDVLAASPWVGIKALPVGEQAVSFWTPGERDDFLAKARAFPHARALADVIEVACHTGMRRGELAGLTWEQVDLIRRVIRVDAVYCFMSGQRLGRTKNRTAAVLPMNEAAYRVLTGLKRRAGGAVFDLEVLRHASARLARLCDRVKVKRVRFHDMRHTFGATLAMADVELSKRQRLMRHKTVAMTDRYTHFAPSYLRKAVESIAGTVLAPVPGGSSPGAQNLREKLEPQIGFEPENVIVIRRVKTPA